MNDNGLGLGDIEFVQVMNGGNHRKLKFCFTAKLIITMRDEH